MMRLFVLLILLFANLAFAQEKAPDLPDFLKWEREPGIHLGYYVAKKNQVGLLDLHFTSDEGFNAMVLFRPVSAKVYEHLKMLLINSPPSELLNKKAISLAGKEPWFLLYYPPDNSADSETVYLYERTSKWSEFYHLWKPRWRFVRSFDFNCTDGSCIEDDEYSKFFEDRYGLLLYD